MKRFLFLLLAAGGLMFATASEASAHNYYGGHGYGRGHRGSGFSISFNRGYGRRSSFGYGYRGYPIRRSFGVGYGYSPRSYSSGYYGGGYYGGGGYGGGRSCGY